MDISKPLTRKEKAMYMVRDDKTRVENIINCQERARGMYFSHALMSHKIGDEEVKNKPAWEYSMLLAKTMRKGERIRCAMFDFRTSMEYARTARVLMGLEE